MIQSANVSPAIPNKGIFISYRRDGGSDVSRIVADYLESSGYDVFLDVDSLGGGHFDEMILREIDKKDTFILICSPGCFDRCNDPQDWVRRELERALERGKKIIPITLIGFKWPAVNDLPESIQDIRRHNCFEYNHAYWKLTRDRIISLIESWSSGWEQNTKIDISSSFVSEEPFEDGSQTRGLHEQKKQKAKKKKSVGKKPKDLDEKPLSYQKTDDVSPICESYTMVHSRNEKHLPEAPIPPVVPITSKKKNIKTVPSKNASDASNTFWGCLVMFVASSFAGWIIYLVGNSIFGGLKWLYEKIAVLF